MTSAAKYTTYTDGDDALPTLLLEDEDGNRLTPSSITFYLKVGDGDSTAYTPSLIETGYYRCIINTTGMGGNWLWGYWVTTDPAKSGDNWQAYVDVPYA